MKLTNPLMATAALLMVPGCTAARDQGDAPASEGEAQGPKPRVVVTTDPELDDLNSLIRYLLYLPDVETEAIVYASSQYHWRGDGEGTQWFMPYGEYRRFGLELCPCWCSCAFVIAGCILDSEFVFFSSGLEPVDPRLGDRPPRGT